MSTVAAVSPSQIGPRPMWHVFTALAAAVFASIFAGSIQQFGTFAALSNATLLSNLVMGAIGMMLILPGINVAVASIWHSKRNSRSRRNIYFWWGVVVAVLQALIRAVQKKRPVSFQELGVFFAFLQLVRQRVARRKP